MKKMLVAFAAILTIATPAYAIDARLNAELTATNASGQILSETGSVSASGVSTSGPSAALAQNQSGAFTSGTALGVVGSGSLFGGAVSGGFVTDTRQSQTFSTSAAVGGFGSQTLATGESLATGGQALSLGTNTLDARGRLRVR